MSRPLALLMLLLVAGPLRAGQDSTADAPASYAALVEHTQQRVVKIYGGALGLEKGYASGVIVRPDGTILTTLSLLLETPALRVVLPDGRRLPAEVTRRDPRAQLALLKVEATDLPAFERGDSTALQVGDALLAAANPFKVAGGPEPVSVVLGVFSGRTQLQARKRTREVDYDGDVLLTDMIISTPGSAGGALVDLRGRLVGLIGKPLTSTRTNTWLNYALPVEACGPILSDQPLPAADSEPDGDDGQAVARTWGIRLFDVGGQVRLAYVERVTPGSTARRAGLRYGDLVLAVAGTPIETCGDFYEQVGRADVSAEVELLVKRGDDVLPLILTPDGAPQ